MKCWFYTSWLNLWLQMEIVWLVFLKNNYKYEQKTLKFISLSNFQTKFQNMSFSLKVCTLLSFVAFVNAGGDPCAFQFLSTLEFEQKYLVHFSFQLRYVIWKLTLVLLALQINQKSCFILTLLLDSVKVLPILVAVEMETSSASKLSYDLYFVFLF